MAICTRKSKELEAFQYGGNEAHPDWWKSYCAHGLVIVVRNGGDSKFPHVVINNDGEYYLVSPLDWIIKSENGFLYPVAPEKFEHEYVLRD